MCVLTKFTLLALIPAAFLIALVRGRRVVACTVTALALYASLLAAYQFQVRLPTHDEIDNLTRFSFGVQSRELTSLLDALPWPPQFVKGLTFIGATNRFEGPDAYMLGHTISGAQPWYFPLC